MLRDFIKKVMYSESTKEEYFKNDHHYVCEEAKDLEWHSLLRNMDMEFYYTFIEPAIEVEDKDVYETSNSFLMYCLCKEIANETIRI